MKDNNIQTEDIQQRKLLHELNRIASALERLALCEEKMIDSSSCSSSSNDNEDEEILDDFHVQTGSLQP